MYDSAAAKVYYDGSCPICRQEINFYQKQSGNENIAWVDISLSSETEIEPNLTKYNALKRFHVKLNNGAIVSGAAAFVALWKALDRFSALGRYLDHPWLLYFLEIFYKLFLTVRPVLQHITHLFRKKTKI